MATRKKNEKNIPTVNIRDGRTAPDDVVCVLLIEVVLLLIEVVLLLLADGSVADTFSVTAVELSPIIVVDNTTSVSVKHSSIIP